MTDFGWAVELLINSVWVDISADVRSSIAMSLSRGIDGTDVTSRVAKVGTLSFALDNSTANSAATLGYYSPDHGSCLFGFGLGTIIRLRYVYGESHILTEAGDFITTEEGQRLIIDGEYVKFYGKISDVSPVAGEYRERYVSVLCVDFMNEIMVHNLKRVAVQTSKRGDQLLGVAIANLPAAPLLTSYATGPDTFAYAFHDVQDERTSAMNAVQRIDQSGLSYTFTTGDENQGETLNWQSRNTRFSLSSVATFDNTMTGLTVNRKADGIYNTIKATGYPSKLGTTNEVLWTSNKEIVIGPAQSMTIEARFTDPSGAGKRVAVIPGTEVTPVADTDYKMSSVSGSGNDKNANLTIAVTWGGNVASISLTNGAAVTCYIWLLQLRGKIIRLYDPLVVAYEDTDSQALYGDRVLSVSFPYQDNIHAIDAFATGLRGRLKDPHTTIDSLEFVANASDANMARAMACDVGRRITVSETVTGITTHDYCIGTYELTQTGGLLKCKLGNLERSEIWNDIGTWEEDPPDTPDAASLDATTNVSSDTATGTSLSFTHTPVGTPSLIVLAIAFYGSADPSDVTATYGGASMVLAGKQWSNIAPQEWMHVFYIFSPAAGAQTVAASWGNSQRYKASCSSVLNAMTYNAVVTEQDRFSALQSVDISGKAHGITFAFVAGNNIPARTPGAGQTSLVDDCVEVPNILGAYKLQSVDGTVTISWTLADSIGSDSAIVAASFYTA